MERKTMSPVSSRHVGALPIPNTQFSSEELERIMTIVSNLEKVKLYKTQKEIGFMVRIGKGPANAARADGIKDNSDGYIFWDHEKQRYLIYMSLKQVLQDLQSGVLKASDDVKEAIYGAVRYTCISINDNFLDFSAHRISTDRSLRRGGAVA